MTSGGGPQPAPGARSERGEAGGNGLPRPILEQVAGIGRADIVVGIPSYNNARTIRHVVLAVQAGLAKYFPGHTSVVVNSDGGSRDGTPDVVRGAALGDVRLLLLAHPLVPIQRLSFAYEGIPGKGSAFRCIFRVAELLGARACAVVDSDLRSITPEWMQLLLAPVVEHGFDYVAPSYFRHKYDGTITNGIVYPLTRALYGLRVRQPIGGDFGLSGRLAARYLTKPVWQSDVARYGIDIWMTTTAICDGFRVCQAFLGAKIHDAKDPGADLSDMLVQVLGTVCDLTETYEHVWRQVRASADVPLVGFPFGVGLEPVHVNVDRMVKRFRTGATQLADVWRGILGAEALAGVERLARSDGSAFVLPDDLWVQVIYDLVAAFHHRVIDREHLLRSALPLYMGWVASFVQQMAPCDAAQVDARLEQLCAGYENGKAYLIDRWSDSGN